MNFITGKNGSGKSTVLTALTTCLGGKAASTNRGSSVKSLIKEGETRAVIRVVLNNVGQEAYEKERYGDEIRVERMVDASSSGSYKIKSATGQTVSTSKAELAKILAKFSIFVDNPFAVLTQDTARSFLTESNSNDKYKHFQRALFLDKIESYREGTMLNIGSQQKDIRDHKKALSSLKAKLEESTKKFEEFKKYTNADNDLRYWTGILEWGEVSKIETEISKQDEEITKLRQRIEEIDDQCNNHESLSSEKQAEIDAVSSKESDIKDGVDKLRQEIENIRQEKLKPTDDKIKNLKSERATLESSASKSKKLLETLEAQKRELLDTSKIEQDRRQKLENQDKLKGQLEDVTSQINQDEERRDSLDNDIERLQSELEQARSRQRDADNKVQKERDHLNDLKKNERDTWSAFAEGPKNVDFKGFMADFEKQTNNFKEPPLGPVGRYVKLVDEKWSTVLEQVLKRMLSSFIVFNKEDEEKLSRLLTRYGLKNSIILRKHDLFDYSHGMPDSQYTTILDVLEISNEEVKRVLIDMAYIERIILIPVREQGERELDKHPRNVRSCLSRNEEGGGGYELRSNNDGGKRSTPIQAFRSMPRLTDDNSEVLRQVQESVREYEQLAKRALNRTSEVNAEKKKKEDERRRLDTDHHRHISKRQKIYSELENLEEELEEDQGQGEEEINKVNSSIEKCKEDVETYEKQKEEFYEELIECQENKNKATEETTMVQNKIKEKNSQLKNLQEEARALSKEKSNIDENKDNSISRKSVCFKDIEKIEETRQSLKNKLAKATKEAESFSDERLDFPEEETPDSIQEKIDKINAGRHAIEQKYGNVSADEVYSEFIQKKKEYDEAKAEYRKLYNMYNSLEEGIELRKRVYQEIISAQVHSIKSSFSRNLSQRGFSGTLDINRGDESLAIKVAPGSDKSKQQSTSTLSGGEKSFSQIALLASLWQNMGSKLLALDEFDVFMDKVNRRISLKMVIDVLRELTSTQSIFITPQELETSDIDFTAPDINLFRINDPQRANASS